MAEVLRCRAGAECGCLRATGFLAPRSVAPAQCQHARAARPSGRVAGSGRHPHPPDWHTERDDDKPCRHHCQSRHCPGHRGLVRDHRRRDRACPLSHVILFDHLGKPDSAASAVRRHVQPIVPVSIDAGSHWPDPRPSARHCAKTIDDGEWYEGGVLAPPCHGAPHTPDLAIVVTDLLCRPEPSGLNPALWGSSVSIRFAASSGVLPSGDCWLVPEVKKGRPRSDGPGCNDNLLVNTHNTMFSVGKDWATLRVSWLLWRPPSGDRWDHGGGRLCHANRRGAGLEHCQRCRGMAVALCPYRRVFHRGTSVEKSSCAPWRNAKKLTQGRRLAPS